MANEAFFASVGQTPPVMSPPTQEQPPATEPATGAEPNIPVPPEKGETPEQLFERIVHGKTAEATPEPKPEVKADPKPEEKKDGLSIPEQFLGVEKKEEDPMAIFSEDPKGPLKHENYKRVQQTAKKLVDDALAKVSELQKQLSESSSKKASDEVLSELEGLRKTKTDLEAILEREAVQETPKFKERFTAREQIISETLKQHATELGVDAEALQHALNSSGKRRAAILGELELDDVSKAQVINLMVQHDLIQKDKGEFLKQSREALAAYSQEQKATMEQQEKQRTAHEEQVFEDVIKQLPGKGFAPFTKVDGNDSWNAVVEQNINSARDYYNGKKSLPELAEIVAKGVGAETISKINEKLVATLKERDEQIAQLKGAQPGANGRDTAPTKEDDSKLTPFERAERTFRQYVQPQNNGWR